jgi:hypothetical protein
MTGMTRRGFLTHASIGAAAGGLAVMAPLQGTRRPLDLPITAGAAPMDDLIAHVRSVPTGEIALMIGSREVVVRDRSLAARLANAARGPQGS